MAPHSAGACNSQYILPSDDNVTTFFDESHEVSKLDSEDMSNPRNKEDDVVIYEDAFDITLLLCHSDFLWLTSLVCCHLFGWLNNYSFEMYHHFVLIVGYCFSLGPFEANMGRRHFRV